MKLSPTTLAILKNFAAINSNIYIPAGNVIKVRNVQRNVFAQATIEESFEAPICLYDLNEFLSVIGIGADGELTIKDTHLVIKWGKSKLNYNFADPIIMRAAIEASEKNLTMPEPEIEFELTSDMLAAIQKSAAILKTQYLSIFSNGGEISVKTYDKEDPNTNAYTLDTGLSTPYTFNMLLDIENLKLLAGNYDVAINHQNISRWSKQGTDLVYHIAMDTHSTFE
jgi:hypothetical protein